MLLLKNELSIYFCNAFSLIISGLCGVLLFFGYARKNLKNSFCIFLDKTLRVCISCFCFLSPYFSFFLKEYQSNLSFNALLKYLTTPAIIGFLIMASTLFFLIDSKEYDEILKPFWCIVSLCHY